MPACFIIVSLVAMEGIEVLGHILFTKIQIISPTKGSYTSLALAPMAVKKTHQNQGIGSKLVRSGLDKARSQGFESVIVLGHD